MRIGFVVQVYQADLTPIKLIERYYSTRYLARSLSKYVELFIFYRYFENAQLDFENVTYYFVKDNLSPTLRHWHCANEFTRRVSIIVKEKKIDLIHAQSQNAALFHWNLQRKATQIPYLIQDHGSPLDIKHPQLKKILLKKANALVCSAEGLADNWIKKGIFAKEKCFFVMEASSEMSFTNITPTKQLRLLGEPIYLWVGNLDHNKDPMTVLKAFQKLSAKYPKARLYMVYKGTCLEKEVKQRINQSIALAKSVILIGYVERHQLKSYYNMTDYYISASYKEGSGYALMEALSCGVTPIVSRIPTFIKLTSNGKIGSLFESGNADQLYSVMLNMIVDQRQNSKSAISLYFKEHFGYDQIALELKDIYSKVLERWKNR